MAKGAEGPRGGRAPRRVTGGSVGTGQGSPRPPASSASTLAGRKKSPPDRPGSADASDLSDRSRTRPKNLSLDEGVVTRAERYAEQIGSSLSRLVNDLLAGLPDAEGPPLDRQLAPAVRRLHGVAARTDRQERKPATGRQAYRDHLARKYGLGR